jgi:hypothetical protein
LAVLLTFVDTVKWAMAVLQLSAGPRLGDGDHIVAQRRQQLLKEHAHVALVIGDGDA